MIKLNGRHRDWSEGTLVDLLRAEGMDPAARGIAIAMNGEVVPRARWGERTPSDGDEIEIVKVLQGG